MNTSFVDDCRSDAWHRFRWVHCQLDYLRSCLPGRIRHTLAELPDTLDETYERTLREIKNSDSELAHRLFQYTSVCPWLRHGWCKFVFV
jgi:hypothetical protein